jgi:hypothetical protein
MDDEGSQPHNNDLKRLENRLKTFDTWPVSFIDKRDLANAGKEIE